MARLSARGIALDLPDGWDGRIRRRETVSAQDRVSTADLPAEAPAIAHGASFSLPSDVGDFGGGAVEMMSSDDVFLSIVEFDADSLGTALFSRAGMPRRLRVGDFGPDALQRTIPGQGGSQAFFTEAGRPFCLYVVVGSYLWRSRVLPAVNEVLGLVTIS